MDCDIEGLDYDVINSYDFSKDGPKVIIVEVNIDDEMEKFDSMLQSKGYYKFCVMNVNAIYIREEYKAVMDKFV